MYDLRGHLLVTSWCKLQLVGNKIGCLVFLYTIVTAMGCLSYGQALAEALQHSRALRILDLRECHIGMHGGNALANALKVAPCPTLNRVDLRGNALSQEAKEAFQSVAMRILLK